MFQPVSAVTLEWLFDRLSCRNFPLSVTLTHHECGKRYACETNGLVGCLVPLPFGTGRMLEHHVVPDRPDVGEPGIFDPQLKRSGDCSAGRTRVPADD